ncbi:MAG: NTP transferase domain-containing protein [Candidatus Aegiribacteria sp.]|nr:NTP transferase domain-containing protein [Candidatus Aegiribacteria sp.]MBD3293948.1 NTP transferase domain-containing protein [Candidatus Fermentibacteria bacterium]
MHAIIPVAGRGTRMRPVTWSVPKVLIRIAGKTMLGHIIDELVNAGVDHITLIVGYLGDSIVEWARESYSDIEIDFARQEKMDGLASAINLAAPMTEDGRTLVVLGDTLFRADLSKAVDPNRNMIAVKRVEDPARFGVVVMDGEEVTGLVEKPSVFVSDLAIVGIYGFSSGNQLMDATRRLIKSGKRTRGEFQLTDAMQIMLEDGNPFGCFQVDGWFDCGKPETTLKTNRILLELGTGADDGEKPENSVLIPPVSIEEGVTIRSSIVGPYVSIASNTSVENSIISNSILGSDNRIISSSIEESITGNGAEINGRPASLIVGSSCSIEI